LLPEFLFQSPFCICCGLICYFLVCKGLQCFCTDRFD
jgi:hypothetical protein